MLHVPTSDSVVRQELDLGDLTPEIRDALAALTEVDTRYEGDRECLEGWAGPRAVRLRLLDHLEARHRRDRQPLVKLLAELYQQDMTALMFRDLVTRH